MVEIYSDNDSKVRHCHIGSEKSKSCPLYLIKSDGLKLASNVTRLSGTDKCVHYVSSYLVDIKPKLDA